MVAGCVTCQVKIAYIWLARACKVLVDKAPPKPYLDRIRRQFVGIANTELVAAC